MKKARDIMTGAVIACAPDTSAAEVARLMRDRDTGDVLVREDGKLVGIVTDRDIAVRMAAEGKDSREIPVKELMSTHIITGHSDWDVRKVAEAMGKYQIRRLPILENGLLVGIVSLGDLALHDKDGSRSAQSLKQISEPGPVHRIRSKSRGWIWGTALGVITIAAIMTRLPQHLSSRWQQT